MISNRERWNIGQPGGPAGPFWSIVSSSGRVIALKIIDEKIARRLVRLNNELLPAVAELVNQVEQAEEGVEAGAFDSQVERVKKLLADVGAYVEGKG